MVRMNLSIPDDLRERMKPFDEGANWSQIAAAAFEERVMTMAELGSIDDAVWHRLRQTEMEDGETIFAQGAEAGRKWAQRSARMIHLRRLSAELEKIMDLETVDPHMVAQMALGDTDARWDDLPGNLEKPSVVDVEAGWLEGFLVAASKVMDAFDSRSRDGTADQV